MVAAPPAHPAGAAQLHTAPDGSLTPAGLIRVSAHPQSDTALLLATPSRLRPRIPAWVISPPTRSNWPLHTESHSGPEPATPLGPQAWTAFFIHDFITHDTIALVRLATPLGPYWNGLCLAHSPAHTGTGPGTHSHTSYARALLMVARWRRLSPPPRARSLHRPGPTAHPVLARWTPHPPGLSPHMAGSAPTPWATARRTRPGSLPSPRRTACVLPLLATSA